MSANFFGNLSQGYFGFYFGPTAESGVSTVSESLTASDSSSALVSYLADRSESLIAADSVLATSSVPASDSSATTMAPGGGITLRRATPIRYDYDGTEIKIKLIPEVVPVVVRTARFKNIAKTTEKASGFQPVIVFVASVKSMVKTAKTPRVKSIVTHQVSVSSRAKTRSAIGSCVVSKFAGATSKSRGFGKASAFVTKTQRIYSFSKTTQSAAGVAQALCGVKKSKARCHGIVSAKQVTEFSQEETEAILAMAEREFFR